MLSFENADDAMNMVIQNSLNGMMLEDDQLK
jgi:hypothetical protein